ncbi:MAG: P-loop NTPase, partial [Clostridia bacterium]|nr:P-loop NTPase [Clostridia bacterium]
FTCPDCGKQIKVFGESHVEDIAMGYGIPLLATLPIDPSVAAACDAGSIDTVDLTPIAGAVDRILSL